MPLFDTDEALTLQVKGKLDWLRDTDETVVDLKTVGGEWIDPANFAKQVANFKYHLQAAHYLKLAKAKRFVFVVVEREFPFQVGIYELDDDALAEGRYLRRQALDLVAQCVAFNDWPGHTDDQVQTLSLPPGPSTNGHVNNPPASGRQRRPGHRQTSTTSNSAKVPVVTSSTTSPVNTPSLRQTASLASMAGAAKPFT